MKTFENLKSGVLEHVTNELIVEQYENKNDMYRLVEPENTKPKK